MLKRTLLAALVLAAAMPAARAGSSPSNDNFANAKPITSLPYTDEESTAGATTESNEPTGGNFACQDVGATVWFLFTPANDGAVQAETTGSNFETELGIYVRDANGALHMVACDGTKAVFGARAGWTYYFQVGGAKSLTSPSYLIPPTGLLAFQVIAPNLELDDQPLPVPPENDDRAHATPITTAPPNSFYDSLVGAGSVEPGEPMCSQPTGVTADTSGANVHVGLNQSFVQNPPTSVWYIYTADHDATLLGESDRHFGAAGFGVYEDSPNGLQQIACGRASYARDQNGDAALGLFPVKNGHTYFIQVMGDSYYLPIDTRFSLSEEPTNDLSVDSLTISRANTSSQDIRTVGFDVASSSASGSWIGWSMRVCPAGNPTGCSEYARDDFLLGPWNEACTESSCSYHVDVQWNTTGCAGDYTIQIHVDDPFNADPNTGNNTASAQTQVGVGGQGVGVPCVSPAVNESVPPSP